MINEFLKAGGVANIHEFYNKFPTEGHFAMAYPEAYAKITSRYKHGGHIPKAQSGMQLPKEEDFNGDYDLYQEALAAYNTPDTLKTQIPQGYFRTAPIERMAPTINLDSNLAQKTRMPQIVLPDMASFNDAPVNVKNTYKGPSLVDLLKSQGLDYTKQARKTFAEANDIEDYSGTYDQNIKLMKMFQKNPEVLKQYTKSIKTNSPVVSVPSLDEPLPNNPTKAKIPGLPQSSLKSVRKLDDSHVGAIIGALGVGLGVGGLSVIELLDVMLKVENGEIGKFSKSGKAQLTRGLNKLINESLQTGTSMLKKDVEWYKNLPKQQQQILKNLDIAEIPGLNLKPGSAMKNVEAWKMLQETAAEKKLLKAQKVKRMLGEVAAENTVVNGRNVRRMVGEAAAENALVNANYVNRMLQEENAAKSLGFGSRLAKNIKQGVQANKYLKEVAGFLKGAKNWIREDGGEIDEYQIGGLRPFMYHNSPIDKYVNRTPTTTDDVTSVFDPTGISNAPYAVSSIRNFIDEPSWGGGADAAWNLAGSIPVIGTGVRTAKKIANISRATTKGEQIANRVGKAVRPIVNVGKKTMAAVEFPATMVNKMYKNRGITSPILNNKAATFNRGIRGWDAMGAGAVNSLDYLFPAIPEYPQKEYGGDTGTYSAGQYYQDGGNVIEVTPEQLQMLKNGGYNFEIIN